MSWETERQIQVMWQKLNRLVWIKTPARTKSSVPKVPEIGSLNYKPAIAMAKRILNTFSVVPIIYHTSIESE